MCMEWICLMAALADAPWLQLLDVLAKSVLAVAGIWIGAMQLKANRFKRTGLLDKFEPELRLPAF